MEESKNKETVGLKSILVRYLRQWKLFLITFILSFIPAILYLTFYPRTYGFTASILFQAEKESGMASFGLGEAAGLMKSFGIGSGSGSISVDDEMEILTSNRMLRMTILDLGLNVQYSKPYSFYNMYHDAPLKLTADSMIMAALSDEYRFAVSAAPGNIKVKATSRLGGINETYTFTSLPAKIKVGADEFVLDFNGDDAREKNFKLKIRCLPAGWLAEDLSGEIEVEEVSTSSNVITLNCSDHSLKRGVDLLNTLVKTYNEDAEAYKRVEDNKTMAFVDDRIAKVVVDLANVEAGIEAYKTKNEMTLLESDMLLYSETFKELQTAIIGVEVEARQIDMLDDYVQNPENKDKVIPSIFSVADGEKGVVAQYNKALMDRDRFLQNSNKENPMYKVANSQVEKLRGGVFVMIENARKSTAKTLADLKGKEREMLSKMRTIPEKERDYISFRRDQEILQGIYLMLLQKREETVLSLGKQTDRARTIDPAYVQKKPLGPRKLFAAIGILVLTLVFPVGYLFVKGLFVSVKEEYKNTKD